MKIAIVGGGPAGLYLAILLKRRQPHHQSVVIEQNAADSTFGFGVVLADSGLSRIQAADAQVYEALVEKMVFNGDQIIRVKEEPITLKHPSSGGAIARIDLLHTLQRIAAEAGVEVRYGVRIDHPRQLADLGLGDADVVVGADGVHSVVRAANESGFGTTQSLLSNHFAWFGTRRIFPTSALVFRQWQGGAFVAHYYPYCATGSTFVAECDHATWQTLGMEAMGNDERQALYERVFAQELDGHALISNNSNWRQFPATVNARFCAGHHVLIGDSHTTAHFSIGSGTRIAMEDAIALADALTAPAPAGQAEPSVAQRLADFETARGPQKAKLLGASRRSYLWYEEFGQWMQRCTPLQFVHAFMMRTGRFSDERLAQQYPELHARMRREGVIPAPAAAPQPGGALA